MPPSAPGNRRPTRTSTSLAVNLAACHHHTAGHPDAQRQRLSPRTVYLDDRDAPRKEQRPQRSAIGSLEAQPSLQNPGQTLGEPSLAITVVESLELQQGVCE